MYYTSNTVLIELRKLSTPPNVAYILLDTYAAESYLWYISLAILLTFFLFKRFEYGSWSDWVQIETVIVAMRSQFSQSKMDPGPGEIINLKPLQ